MGLLRYFWVLLLLVVAAVLGVWLRHDPGLLFMRLRGYEIRTTLLFGGVLLVLALLALWLLWWLMFRAPQRWKERQRTLRIRDLDLATLARIEGRPRLAEKLYERAAEHPALRAGALLQASEQALVQDQRERAQGYLGRAAPYPSARASARLLALSIRGEDDHSKADLDELAQTTNPPPAALQRLARVLSNAGDWQPALAVLEQARRSRSMLPEQFHSLQRSVLVSLLGRVGDSEAMLAVWRGAGDKRSRREPTAIAALAAAERRLGHDGLAADALETALKHGWDEQLACLYAKVPLASTSKLLRRAEQRLAAHPQSPGLLLALARLCRRDEIWGKARDYLNLVLATSPSAAAWEEWAELNERIGDQPQARRGYRNALSLLRGEPPDSAATGG